MAFQLFAAPEREPSQFVGFAGNRLHRDAENRDETALPAALADPGVRILLMKSGRLYLKLDDGRFDPYHDATEAAALKARLDQAVLLGHHEGGPVVAAPAGVAPEELPEHIKAIDHRSIYIQGLVGEDTLGEIAQGAALMTWHATHRFCGRCGSPTEPRIGGYKRVCTSCEAQLFPRTDPVVIMLAVTSTHAVLGRSPHFGPGMYSALAGFVEPGETIENAVRREIGEESGLTIGRVVYHASQPWPFPHSLMIGCFGEAVTQEIRFDANELEDCRWFSRDEVRRIVAGEHPEISIPPAGAIATHLIRAWAEAG